MPRRVQEVCLRALDASVQLKPEERGALAEEISRKGRRPEAEEQAFRRELQREGTQCIEREQGIEIERTPEHDFPGFQAFPRSCGAACM